MSRSSHSAPDPASQALLERYYAGGCSVEERRQAEQLLEAHRVEGALVDALRTHCRAVPREAAERDAVFDAVMAHVPTPVSSEKTRTGTFSSRTLYLKGVNGDCGNWAGTFARLSAVCAIMLIGFGAFLFRSSTPPAVQHYVTAPGQRSIVRWDDGSTMRLAPSTSVDVTSRHVIIRGEAYFTVVPHASRSFVVQTSNALVQVLGTTFSVRQYLGEAQSRVVVEDGKVALRVLGEQSNERAVLAAGMMARTTDSTIRVTPGIVVSDYTGWTHGSLVFNRVALSDLLEELSRAYGVHIRVADTTLARHQMTMQVLVNSQSLARVLDLIGMVANAHYTVDGATYVLAPGRSSIRVSPRLSLPQPEKQYGR